jgi:hypothetical protein
MSIVIGHSRTVRTNHPGVVRLSRMGPSKAPASRFTRVFLVILLGLVFGGFADHQANAFGSPSLGTTKFAASGLVLSPAFERTMEQNQERMRQHRSPFPRWYIFSNHPDFVTDAERRNEPPGIEFSGPFEI